MAVGTVSCVEHVSAVGLQRPISGHFALATARFFQPLTRDMIRARRAVPEAAPIAPAEHTCCALHGGTQMQDVLLGEAAPKWDCEAPSSP